jgi:hypothetical protein
MAATVRGAIRELLEQTMVTVAPGQWTYRVIAKHVLSVEQDSLRVLAADQSARDSRTTL